MLTHTPSGLWAVVPLMLFDWLRAAPTHTIFRALWPCAVECRLPPALGSDGLCLAALLCTMV